MSLNTNIKIFGIRHHGPGSSKALIKALDDWQPDLLLIEGPPDADVLIKHISNENLKPPVALLVYNPKDLQQASYFPFADFSPEWQAIKWALKHSKTAQFMDLPLSLQPTIAKSEEVIEEILTDINQSETQNPKSKIEHDPLSYMAEIAGYTDSERWWEITFEQNENPIEIFDAILKMMAALRQELNRKETDETLYREAYMRQTIRKSFKNIFQKIAVICGAWHAPVLNDFNNFNEKKDNDLIKTLKKTPTEATWVPWSYDRLSRDSGYGAGIISPAWYELLFSKRANATIRWMTKAARLLRKEDLSASSAHAIEAVRLAETLAILRGRSIAGMDELEEATLSIFCDGYDAPMKLIREKLVIGDIIGKVPPEIPQVPLQRDLEAAIKKARLSKEYATTEGVTKELDLRKDTHLFASYLLHRLNFLNIPWGKPLKGSRFKLGSFSEIWKLQWKPDYAIRIIEAAQWGNTIEEAAVNMAIKKATAIQKLPDLTELVEKALDANLKTVIPMLIQRLQEMTALTEDVLSLMQALSPLVNIVKYGNVRGTDAKAVQKVIDEIIPRICIGFPAACINTDDDATELIFNVLNNTNKSINLLADVQHITYWHNTLGTIAHMRNAHGTLSGAAIRILFDKKIYTLSATTTAMRYALSRGNEPKYAAAWLEGFLYGSGLVLIHNEQLWQILDEWVEEIEMERLMELLPLLRRTFSNFSASERQKMLVLAQKVLMISDENLNLNNQNDTVLYDVERGELVLKTLQTFL